MRKIIGLLFLGLLLAFAWIAWRSSSKPSFELVEIRHLGGWPTAFFRLHNHTRHPFVYRERRWIKNPFYYTQILDGTPVSSDIEHLCPWAWLMPGQSVEIALPIDSTSVDAKAKHFRLGVCVHRGGPPVERALPGAIEIPQSWLQKLLPGDDQFPDALWSDAVSGIPGYHVPAVVFEVPTMPQDSDRPEAD